jgi:hypothetical protein
MRPVRLALIALVIALTVVGCGDDDTSPTEAATTAAPESEGTAAEGGFFDGLEADWGVESLDGLFYGITVTFNGRTEVGSVFAEIGYPGLDCAGRWTLTSVDGDTVTADEEILLDPDDACTNGGSVDLTRSGNTMAYQWYYPSGRPSDTGTLTPGG